MHDLKLKTSAAYDRVEHILEACCTKLYSMTFEGLEETENGSRKVIRISFEDPADRERFRAAYQKSREELPSVAAIAAAFGEVGKRMR